MNCRGVRGAITVEANTKEAILAATEELLRKLIEVNHLQKEDVAMAIFTTTTDLNAVFPAAKARELGWTNVALMCGHEIDVPNSLPMCLRITAMVNTDKKQEEIVHVYMKGAQVLRPDLPPA